MGRTWSHWLVVSLLSATFLVACAAPAAPSSGGGPASPEPAAPRAEKRIVYSVTIPIDVRPTASLGASQPILPLIGSGLSTRDGQGGRVPILAREIPSLDNGLWRVNADGTMVTTFRLHPTAKWHDGTPITADDFLFSLEVGQDRAVPAFGATAYPSIADATGPDPASLVISWREPYVVADALFSWDQGYGAPLPRHLLQEAATTNKAGFLDLTYWDQDFIGSGPFKVASWEPGVGMQLVAHDGYALGRPKLDRIDVQIIPDFNTLIAGLLAGSVDAANTVGSIDTAIQLRERWQGGTILFNTGVGALTEIFPQLIDPQPRVITDLRFRTAMAVAIDRQAIADAINYGLTPVPLSFLNPNQPLYAALEATLPRYFYDPQRAAQILADMGYAKGSDGMLRDAAGGPLNIEVRSAAVGSPEQLARAATAIADDWQRIGAAATPARIPPHLANNAEYLATFPGFYVAPRVADADGLRQYTSANTPLPSNRFSVPSPVNASRYTTPELDDLVATYFRTIPIGERAEVMGRIVHILVDRLALLGLYYNVTPGARSNRLSGVGPMWAIVQFPWNAHQWDVEG